MSPTPNEEPLPPPTLIEDDARFGELLELLAESGEIAIDTEADSFYSYQERVCLIQITAGAEDFLVDPLADLDVSRLGPILADPTKTKVFHDGEYDVLILKRDYGFEFARLFDTRVAAAALGLELPGLASVVQERFGVELDKSQQRSDWSKRPLTELQIAYAREDTRYLLPLMHQLSRELEERGRMKIVAGECRRLEALEAVARTFDPDEFIRLKGVRTLDPRQRRILRELFVWRDGEAKRRNVPPFKVLGNHALLAAARSRPRSLQALERVEGFSPKIVRRAGRALVDVVRRAEQLDPIRELPRLPARDGTSELDEASVELHERLKSWRKVRAKAEGIDSSLILNRHTLIALALEKPADLEGLAAAEGLVAWQLELFGSELLGVLRTFREDLEQGRLDLSGRRGRRRASSRDNPQPPSRP